MLTELKTALGLSEGATVSDVREAIDRVLLAEMSEEERAEVEAALAAQDIAAEAIQAQAALRESFKLSEDAGWGAIIAAVPKADQDMKERTTLALQVKELSEKVTLLEPMAKKAEALERESKTKTKEFYFAEQVRAGKLTPADRPFYEQMWEHSESAVREHFEKKPKGSAVKLTETGLDTAGEPEPEDPRMALRELSEKRAVEKGISLNEALAQIKAEKPDLVEAVANTYGPAGLRR